MLRLLQLSSDNQQRIREFQARVPSAAPSTAPPPKCPLHLPLTSPLRLPCTSPATPPVTPPLPPPRQAAAAKTELKLKMLRSQREELKASLADSSAQQAMLIEEVLSFQRERRQVRRDHALHRPSARLA